MRRNAARAILAALTLAIAAACTNPTGPTAAKRSADAAMIISPNGH